MDQATNLTGVMADIDKAGYTVKYYNVTVMIFNGEKMIGSFSGMTHFLKEWKNLLASPPPPMG